MRHQLPVIAPESLMARDRLEHWLRMNRHVFGYGVDEESGRQTLEPREEAEGNWLTAARAFRCAYAASNLNDHGTISLSVGPITVPNLNHAAAVRSCLNVCGFRFAEEQDGPVTDFCPNEPPHYSNAVILGLLDRLHASFPDDVFVPLFIHIDNGVG